MFSRLPQYADRTAFALVCPQWRDAARQQALTLPTTYPGNAQRKVFLQERAASFLLATQPQWRTKAADPFIMGWSMTRFREHPTQAFISDALKIAFREQGYPEYMAAFAQVRDHFATGRKAA